VSKPEAQTVLAYGMREVSHGKWEAFRVRVPVSQTESLTPIHRVALTETKWVTGQVPDHREPDNPRAMVNKKILADVPVKDALGRLKYGPEKRGERMELAERRMREAQRLEQQLGLRKPTSKGRAA
jgi:hypothetical protein